MTLELDRVTSLLNEAVEKNIKLGKDVSSLRSRLRQTEDRLKEEREARLDSERQMASILKKKQRRFDQRLAEERLVSSKCVLYERERAEAWEKTQVLARSREQEEVRGVLEETENNMKAVRSAMEDKHGRKDAVDKHVLALEMYKRGLESKCEEMRIHVEELKEDELQVEKDTKLRMEVINQVLKAQYEWELQACDEMGEDKRRQLLKQLRELKMELEDKEEQLGHASAGRKKLEGELKEVEDQLEATGRRQDDTVKQLRKVHQGQVKELQRKLEDSSAAQEVLSSALDSERRAKARDLTQLQEELSASERARKQAEAKRDELSEELASNSSGKSLLSVDKRHLEAKIRHLEEELEEEQSNLESFQDRLRKSQQLVDQLGVELARERSSSQSRDGSRQQLERLNRELRATLQEIQCQGRSELKSCITALKSKLREAEEQLELERRKQQSNAKALCQKEKKVKDLSIQLEDKTKQSQRYSDQVEKANWQVKQLQRELEEASETTDGLRREVVSLRKKL